MEGSIVQGKYGFKVTSLLFGTKFVLCIYVLQAVFVTTNLLVRVVACAVTKTKCPLLTALFSLLSSLSSLRRVTFLPEGVIVGF